MESKGKVDAGICGFKAVITARSEDGMHVDLKVVSACETIKELAARYKELCPINAYEELNPNQESVILEASRPVLTKKGCCEACIVPVGVCKTMYVAAGLALPKDVDVRITKV